MGTKMTYRLRGNPKCCRGCGSTLVREETPSKYDRSTGQVEIITVEIRCPRDAEESRDACDIFLLGAYSHDFYRWTRKATKQDKRKATRGRKK